MVNGLVVFNLDHFLIWFITHLLTQLKEKEQMSGGDVGLVQEKTGESLKEIYEKLWPQQRSVYLLTHS